jgi:predicted PurR-regulated permease PerM
MSSTESLPEGPPPPAEKPAEAGTVALVILAVLAGAAVVTWLGPILRPLLLAIFIFFAVRSAAAPLLRWHFPPWLAYLTLSALTLVAAFTISLFVYGQAMAFRDRWPQYQERVLSIIPHKGEAAPTLRELFKVSTHDIFSFVFEQSMYFVELICMTFFYLLFLILGSRKLPARIQRAFPGEVGERSLKIGERISEGMESFMRIKTLVSLGLGFSTAVLMYLFDLPQWLLWGFLFFALNYITYIGSIAACAPPIVMAFLEFPSPLQATILSVLIVGLRFLWIDWIEIRWSGKHLNIDSALLFLWLAYWGWVWGVLGLILAYPSIVAVKIVLEHLPNTKGWAVLMSED